MMHGQKNIKLFRYVSYIPHTSRIYG